MNNRLIGIIAVLIITLGMISVSTGTFAYFTDSENTSGNSLSAWTSAVLTQTEQSDFETGSNSSTDTSSVPGSILLASQSYATTDSYTGSSMIASSSNLDISGGQIYLGQDADSGTVTLRPNDNGHSTSLRTSGASSNYLCVDEETADDDSTYVYNSSNSAKTDYYEMEDSGLDSVTIDSVTVYVRVNGFLGRYKINIYTDDESYSTSYAYIWSLSYDDSSVTYSTNPETNQPWTVDEIDALECGITFANKTGQCTQVWMEVNYSASSYYTSGTLTSTDLLSSVSYRHVNRISFDVADLPENTGLSVAFSQNGSQWCDSAGNDDEWDDLSEGETTLDLSGTGFTSSSFYYRAQFESDGSGSAALEAMTFYCSVYVSSGTFTSAVIDTDVSDCGFEGIFWDTSLPENTELTLQMRSRNSSFSSGSRSPSWTSLSGTEYEDGTYYDISGLSAGRYIQWRAVLTSSDNSSTPALEEIRFYYTE